MDRKKFLRNSLTGLGTIATIPTLLVGCTKEDNEIEDPQSGGDCSLSPVETAGPFPIKSPAQLVRENIIGDRAGVALLINLVIQDQSSDCQPMSNVFVDLWHCDADGNYSQYGGTGMQISNYTQNNFLRGRQTTNSNGEVSFISVFPGWYSGRAPHIHIEVLDLNEKSIRVTQIAFPEEICNIVYANAEYRGKADTSNDSDNVFSDSLDGNMLDSISGSIENGYTLTKTIIV